MSFTLNYDNMLFLDAEDLAEAGIKKAYDSLARRAQLRRSMW